MPKAEGGMWGVWEERLRRALLSLFFISLGISIALQQTMLGLLLAFAAYTAWRNQDLPTSLLGRPLLGVLAVLLLSTFLSPAVWLGIANCGWWAPSLSPITW